LSTRNRIFKLQTRFHFLYFCKCNNFHANKLTFSLRLRFKPPPNKRVRIDDQDDSSGLGFILRAKRKPAESKFNRYLQSFQSACANLLDYWQQCESEYPHCALLARKYLSIPATSVQSERLFSASGRVITKSRSRLLPDRAESLVFLNKNIELQCTECSQ